ncbi:unnamed protein product [Phyllotreta striolata]|uniref:Uncharacterized protein n=1 Tax=Phyllotreta striolata TaxID=444603 RepID=A0A9N9TIQ2_PHYSR|nr:unnamed protein product [Phyllotreta striolata]
MVETGSYDVTNNRRRKDTSFKSFICALLAFLALLILISLLLWSLGSKSTRSSDLTSASAFSFRNGNKTQTTEATTEATTIRPTTKTKGNIVMKTTTETHTTFNTTTQTPSTTQSVESTAEETTTNTTISKSEKLIVLITNTTDATFTDTTDATFTDVTNATFTETTDATFTPETNTTTQQDETSTVQINTTPTTTPTPTETPSTSVPDVSTTVSEQPSTNPDYTSIGEADITLDDLITKTPNQVPAPIVPPVPTTCNNGVCKRAASSMLATMSHEDKLDKCEDYYKFICEGPQKHDDSAFFRHSFKGFAKKIGQVEAASPDHMRFFADFYNSCNRFGDSLDRLRRLDFLKGTEGASLTEAVKTSVLRQTFPFFDIGLNVDRKNFILEITLPGLTYFKTTLDDWSLIQRLQEQCINEQADKIEQYTVELDKISDGIKTCVAEKTEKYVAEFVDEMKKLSVLPGLKFLDDNVKAGTASDDLKEILNAVQDGLAAYRSSNSKKIKPITLGDLKGKYDFGLDWIEFFKGIMNMAVIDDSTVVYFSENLDGVFNKLVEKKANLKQLVDLWYNLELYKNIVIEKEVDNRGYQCLETVTQLMPEVASFIIAELNANKKDLYKEVREIIIGQTVSIYTSFIMANMTESSAKILQDRLPEVRIQHPEVKVIEDSNYAGIFDFKDPYPKKLTDLLEHFRKSLFSLYDTPISGEELLKYFINAFATKPQTYPPSRVIAYQPGFLYGKSTKLPTYVKLAKLGLPVVMQLSKHFTKNDFEKPLEDRERKVYEQMEKTFNTEYLMNKIKYTVENIDFEIEDSTGNHLNYDSIFAENMAFRLETDAFEKDENLEYLPFLQDFDRAQSFIVIALQEYCDKNTLPDFIGDYYKRLLPAPIKFRNILKNSEFYSKSFNCTDTFERKQFPYINPTP